MGESIAEVAADSGWFCDRGNFWGTIQQFVCCAKCGKHEVKRHDEPRHYAGIFTARFHTICDRCFDTLPNNEEATDHAR